MELTSEQVIDLFARLSGIETELKNLSKPGAMCAVHADNLADLRRRMEGVEQQQGKQNLIAATLGAIGAAIVLAVRYVTTR